MAEVHKPTDYMRFNQRYNAVANTPLMQPQQKVYSFNPYQNTQNYFYPTPGIPGNMPNTDINAIIRSQVMPVKQKEQGYTEVTTFEAPFIDQKGKLYMLDNGQGVVIIPRKGQGPTTIKTFVKAGSFNEKKNRGISHYIEHNLFNGSEGLAPNEFVERVTGMGGLYNASTDTADTDYYIRSPLHEKKDLKEFMTMHANMLHYPTFTEEMLEKEKGPVISEIQMYQDDPYDKAFNEMVKNLFGIKADYQGLIAGSSEIIENLNRDDVVNYYNEWYRPDNMVTVIVGDVNPEETIKMVSDLFNRKKLPPDDPNKPKYYESLNLTDKPVRKDFFSPQLRTVRMQMGLAGPRNIDTKDTLAAMGLITALVGHKNARLTEALKPFNTDATSMMGIISPDYNAPQLIEIDTDFAPGQEEQGLQTVYSVLNGLKTNPPTPQEMFIIKNKLKDNMLSVSESSMGIADMVGESIVGHGDLRAYTDIEKTIDNLTTRDLQNAAQKYIDLNRVSIVMMHPEEQKKQMVSATQTPDAQKISFGSSSDKFKFTRVQEYDLPNKLHVAINDNPNAIRTSADLKVKTDNFQTLKPGVSDILSVMMNKGTRNYSEEQLNQIIDVYNLGIAAGVDNRSINLTADCPKDKLPMAIRVMKEMLYNPDLSQEKFEKAKQEIKQAYSSIPKDPADRALEALYPDHMWGETIRKVLENIDKVTLNDVKTHHQRIIADSQGIMAVDGPISTTPGLGQSLFNEMQYGIGFNKPYHPVLAPESKPLTQNLVIAEPEQRDQAHIVQVFKIKESGNIKDHAALILLNEILGGNSKSKLFMDLRETQKLAYKVKSLYNTDGKYGNLALMIKTTTEDDLKGENYGNVRKSIDGFRKHINNLITTPVNPEELEAAKKEVKTGFSKNLEFSSGRSGRLQGGFNTFYGDDYNNELLNAIDKLNPKDIQNAAKLYLNKPSVISMIASPGTIENTKPYLASLGNLEVVNSN